MALTDAQKAAIKRHLGYHAVSQSLYPIVEGFYTVDFILTNLPAETEAEVTSILAALASLETQAKAAPGNLTLEKAEDVTFRGPGELDGLWREIARWRRELATILGIPSLRSSGQIVVT